MDLVEDWQDAPDGPVVVSLARLKADNATRLVGTRPDGVKLANADDTAELLPWLEGLSHIVHGLDKYVDGRTLTQSQPANIRSALSGRLDGSSIRCS